MDEVRRHARKNLIRGAVMLWIVAPLFIGGGIALITNLANDGHRGALVITGVVIWAILSLIVLLGGFGSLLIGVFLWWKARQERPVVTTNQSRSERDEVLRDLRGGARSAEPTSPADDSLEPGARR